MRPPLRLLLLGLLLAALVTGGVVVVGTVTAKEPVRDEEPFRTTALEDFDAAGLVVRRASFCSAIDPRQVEAALGAAPEAEKSWSNGDRIEVSEGIRDVVHEYGCEYDADGTTARAWVFAPPITARRARQLLTKSPVPKDVCQQMSSPGFGDPSAGWACLGLRETVATYRGLFGDAWLTCELRTGREESDPLGLYERAGSWCVGVLQAASSGPTAED